ncbi:MAG: type II toxin-antitoxin system HipA family toxin YjjJ [Thermodesulfobacteriota bacterium]|nr:type II toxin-antitoxin system HipA family toxin YjjJ [Thermodesulfobacteriota bacterium]
MERIGQQDIRFRDHLGTGALTSKALQERLSMSQTTLSRVVQRNKKDLLISGAARSTRYALRKNLAVLGYEIPVYEIDQVGDVHPYANLHPLASRQYGWQLSGEKTQLFDHLPYMIQNARPEGFMGRAFAHSFAKDLGLPEKLDSWSDEHVITALSQRGEDFVGNLIIGKESVERYLMQARPGNIQAIPLDRRQTIFQQLAEKAIAGDSPGSSAGGEQPKFTALLETPDGYQRAIVKFSSLTTDEGRRWSDLLVCEHLANEVLLETGFSVAPTEIVQTDDWIFLQSGRFDRAGLWGRLPLYSLTTIASEFVGYCETWVDAAEQLYEEKLIAQEDVDSLRWLSGFGTLIGNTDMHLGNISLTPGGTGFRLAPVYDMTPMYYRPKAGGVLPQEVLQAGSLSIKISTDSIAPVATRFWQAARSDTRITDQFRSICQQNIGTMKALNDGPTMRL